MAFCNNCGKNLEENARFCKNCGALVPESVAPAEGTPGAPSGAAAQTEQSKAQHLPASGTNGNLIKVVLIIGAVIVGLAILAGIGLMWAGHRFAKDIHVQREGGTATVETPWGTVRSNDDPVQVAHDLGVEVYPGARAVQEANSVRVGNMTVGTVQFETTDSIEKVASFYRDQFPDSTVESAQEGQRTIVSQSENGVISIVLRAEGDGTHILISRTGKQSNASRR